ncbi:uncharacterized protein BDZ83DRAFT_616018 [Colletotrichum acutatum]|uniref:Uncharacterized protein n=1 Tax=Glomerella acutata TaxID=27357 RepID=A0AAD8URE2_GLOAC|nr:uncharacterized protein BDZ83DRAFT_616018 [Colletotrichum acutatum]KAK1726484.1 hypothetical protein BDZ83DRAFT_616018 [Colletotrichum acutatum]
MVAFPKLKIQRLPLILIVTTRFKGWAICFASHLEKFYHTKNTNYKLKTSALVIIACTSVTANEGTLVGIWKEHQTSHDIDAK